MKTTVMRYAAATILAASVGAAWAQEPDSGVIRFEIARFAVSGNTLLPQARVDAIVQPFAGPSRDFGDVQRALEALEQAYHELGYNLVQVELPEQELNKGVVRLKVVQTRIGKVKVEGNQYFGINNIAASVPQLVPGQTPNIRKVSSGVRLANENPAKKITLQLASGEGEEEVDAVLKVADESPWKWAANFDNTGTGETGRTHAGVSMQHANVGGRDHVLSLQYTTTVEKPSQVGVYGMGYHIPLYSLGDSLDFFGSYSNVDSGTVAAGIFDLQVSGKGTVLGSRYNHNLGRVGQFDPKLVYGIDYKAFKNTVNLNGLNLGNDVTVHPLSVAFNGAWMLDAGEANVSATLVRNVAGGSKGGSADFNKVRIGAKANFTALRLAASYNTVLAGDWQVRAIATGQLSADSLIPGEQFGAGGAGSVRGFAEREIANDNGVQANLELYTPNLCPAVKGWVLQCRAVAFLDAARATRNHALPGELDKIGIAGTGLGARILLDRYASLQFDYGRVLDDGPLQNHDKHRLHVRLGLSY
jgi:hemolysin activation/secretion protein